jgi:hypothetical protein
MWIVVLFLRPDDFDCFESFGTQSLNYYHARRIMINPWWLKSKKELPWYCINVALMTPFASETECQTILWMEPHLSSTSRRETFAVQRRYRTRQTEVGTGRLQVRIPSVAAADREAASQTPCSDDPLDLFP